MKAKLTVAVGVFIFGFLLCVGSVGTLDYMDACGEKVTDSVFIEMIIRSVLGLICMAVSLIIGSKVPLGNDDNNEDTNTVPISEEAEHLKNLGCRFAEFGGSIKTSAESMTKLTESIRNFADKLAAFSEKNHTT